MRGRVGVQDGWSERELYRVMSHNLGLRGALKSLGARCLARELGVSWVGTVNMVAQGCMCTAGPPSWWQGLLKGTGQWVFPLMAVACEGEPSVCRPRVWGGPGPPRALVLGLGLGVAGRMGRTTS